MFLVEMVVKPYAGSEVFVLVFSVPIPMPPSHVLEVSSS